MRTHHRETGRRFRVFLLFLALLLLGGTPAAAMRCGGRLVSTGDYSHEVLVRCGEPVHVERWEMLRQTEGFFSFQSWEQVRVEEWLYNLGSNRFMRVLRFENGRLVSERTAGKGFED